nr:hypothetical protein DO63_5807 [Burkholderia pseudomallei]
MRERLDRALRRVVEPVAGQLQRERRAREVDDPAAVGEPLRRFAQRVEGAAHVDVEDPVERVVGGVGERPRLQDARVVDEHVDAAELPLDGVEHPAHVVRAPDVRPHRERGRAARAQLGDERVGFGAARRIVDGDRKAVARKAPRDGRADAARRAGDERDSGEGRGVHDQVLDEVGGWDE